MVSLPAASHAADPVEMESYKTVKLRSLDKVTARNMTFEVNVGDTVKFGDIFIKVQACRKPPEIEKPEPSAFLQVWENKRNKDSSWIFSGWMFASSPGLSSMDHPIYDVWVLDCLEKDESLAASEEEFQEEKIEVEDLDGSEGLSDTKR